jgi:hypothetical protein
MRGTPAIVSGQRRDANRTEKEFRDGWTTTNGLRPVPAGTLVEVKFWKGGAKMICKAGNPALAWGRDNDDPSREVRVWRPIGHTLDANERVTDLAHRCDLLRNESRRWKRLAASGWFTAVALIFAAVTLLSGCAQYDPGGSVAEYTARARSGVVPALIDYPCYSSCTIYLISPRTCYTPDATFHFHGVRNASTNQYDPRGSRVFAARFWPEMRAHLLAHDALRSPDEWYVMTGAEVAALDTVERECQI